MDNLTSSSHSNVSRFDCVVVGAGLAGSYIANQLVNTGQSVGIIEKSRGTGGRAGSKRIEGDFGTTSVDLGATSIQFEAKELETLKHELLEKQLITPWQINTNAPSNNTYVGLPRASAITRYLIEGATLICSTKAHHIEKETNGWLIRDDKYQPVATSKYLIIATPPSQAAMLLATIPDAKTQLQISVEAAANTVPQWAMWLIANGASNHSSINVNSDILETVVQESSKPGRNVSADSIWALQTKSDWAKQNIDAPKEWIANQLIQEFKRLTQFDVAESGTPHRWFLARQKQINDATKPIWNSELNLGLAGDWLCQGDAQGALLSAHHLAQRII